MAEGLDVSISGVSDVKSSLNNLIKDIESNIDLNKILSSTLAQKASAIAPKLTGALASSVVGNPSAEKAQILAGSAAVPYAGVIEYGWPERNIKAQPYLGTAVKNNMDYVIEEYNKSIEQSIKKYNLN